MATSVENTTADETLAEITEALTHQAPYFEGLLDFARLNLEDPAAAIIREAIRDQDHRRGLLGLAKEALENLLADGYPGDPVQVIDAAAYTDMQNQVRTVSEALSRFAPDAATPPASQLNLTAGATEPKPSGRT